MIEKVNPSHPDKVADRIAGALVDLAYEKEKRPKIAVEVLIGHGNCHIIAETSVHLTEQEVLKEVMRICETDIVLDYLEVPQDAHLAANQKELRCGDNGIFKGVPTNNEERRLSKIIRQLYEAFPTDGKFIYDCGIGHRSFIACQSNCDTRTLKDSLETLFNPAGWPQYTDVIVNPLGDWTGGTDVDTGATNRKLGSDMGRAVTGGGLHGKDLSKADVSVNIYCRLLADEYDQEVEAKCAIGDKDVEFVIGGSDYRFYVPYEDVVEAAGDYVKRLGGFEKLAEWGLF